MTLLSKIKGLVTRLESAGQLTEQTNSQLKPKAARWEDKKTTLYSDPSNRTKAADKENKESKLAWIVPNRRNCKKPYNNQYSDRNIQAHKTEDDDSFNFGFLLSNKY